MGRLTVDRNGRTFEKDGKPFFYLADTIWSAFTNVTETEWEYYLDYRKAQGFTALQINVLPQWDRCMVDVGGYPFPTEDGAVFDFGGGFQESYFSHAADMCRVAVEKGFQLALVLLWVNYAPGTWGSRICDRNIMPKELLRPYTEKVHQVFDCFDPIYIVSGDTDFDTPEAVEWYREVLDTICRCSPDTLKGLHIKRGYDVIPEDFVSKIDFYMYQSGHNCNGQDMAYKLAENMWARENRKPVINSEPCYEQMGYSRNIYGRFEREDVRHAAWQSILSGACAGITYGAHGIWNWYTAGMPKNKMLGEGFDTARIWQDALKFPGAWDYGYIRELLEAKETGCLTPVQELIENSTEEIRGAVGENGMYLFYLPCNTKLVVKKSLENYQVRVLDLEERRSGRPEVTVTDGKTQIAMHRFEKDALILAWPENR